MGLSENSHDNYSLKGPEGCQIESKGGNSHPDLVMEIIKAKFQKPNHNFLIKDLEELGMGVFVDHSSDESQHSNHALYEHLVTRDIDKPNVRELAKIIAEYPEEKMLGNHREGKEMALLVTPGKQGGSKEGFGSGQKKKDNRKCYKCGEVGHFNKKCPKYNGGGPVAYAVSDNAWTIGNGKDGTFADSASTGHVWTSKKDLVDFVPRSRPLVRHPMRNGGVLSFENDKVWLNYENKRKLFGVSPDGDSGLMIVNGNAVCESSKVKENVKLNLSDRELRHQRLGHLGERMLSKIMHYTSAPLQLIVTDVSGPYEHSIGDYRYFMTIIDDYSRFVEVFLLRRKSEATDSLLHFINQMHIKFKNNGDYRVGKIRRGNGGEFTSAYLNEELSKLFIDHQLAVPYTPELNRIAERFNRTVREKAKSMMFHAKLPKKFGEKPFFMLPMSTTVCHTRRLMLFHLSALKEVI
ncbi:hypothetical protein TRICI_003699 [Trichomonascus ciferrii]|uniref:Uncharacterized protein n=1 Tax=Trichomonascus ciferrii TaxID=44093 RepID=A0A642V870_9ASCO|nr:hypothetical protein TRICI_003699 [Trichomonascus ciferrii]